MTSLSLPPLPHFPSPAPPRRFDQRMASSGGVAVRTPYLRVVGLEPEEDGAGRTVALFSPEEEEEFRTMVR
jgi:hypothetical protein